MKLVIRYFTTIFVASIILCAYSSANEIQPFSSAKPIWPQGRETEKNLCVGFRADVNLSAASLMRGQASLVRLTASTLYRLFVNGQFIGHGPARGPHGYYRVDEWDVSNALQPGDNWVAVEVAGYNANSYYLLDQPSFLQAEWQQDAQLLASTSGDGEAFKALLLDSRIEKVQRYSFQRPFIEAYKLNPDSNNWRDKSNYKFSAADELQCEVVGDKKYLPRRVSYPRFDLHPPVRLVATGEMQNGVKPEKLWKDRSLTNIGPQLGGYPESELDLVVSNNLQTFATKSINPVEKAYQWGKPVVLKTNQHAMIDFGTNLSGFIGAKVKCAQKTRLVLTFDEILSDGDVDWKRLGCVNAVSYELEKGEYELESFEPYTLRYLKAIVLEGACEIESFYLRDYVNPDTQPAAFACSDVRLNQLFEAGRETFVQNSVDIFMDCPSRERAGWLCDSFFTSRVAFDLSRDCRVETNFYENFLMPDGFKHLPDGMLPMCYPADHNDGVFIPNWAMWFVIELDEYYQRSDDRAMVDALKPKIMKLLAYFKPFENEDGLLEKLQSWVFIEWSAANQFVQDVNYPSNMLYAGVLDAAGRLYGDDDLRGKAERIRETIRQQSFDGKFFIDNAVRENGELKVTQNHSEVCQYFAFFFDVANAKTHPELWKTLRDEFGPQRKETKAHPEVHFANSFVGNVLRLEILSEYGRGQQILDESIAYLLYMADRTGTLWENDGAYASCNHGFASHIVHVLYRDVLGAYRVDPVNKKIQLRFSGLNLNWCEGVLPLADGDVAISWRKENDVIKYRVDVPAGYTLSVENIEGTKSERVY